MSKLGLRLLAGASAAAFVSVFAVAQAQDAGGEEEVIVTAQRRAQNVQKVPITVTPLSAKALETAGVVDSRNLTLVTPGLNFSNQTATASPNIRGVQTRGIGPGDEPSVPIYIDGVYQPSTHAGFFSFNNIQRIEVLKGPQGTLFGRNASGGAINVVTLDPQLDPMLKGDVSYGSQNEVRVNLYGTAGITDTLAMNVAFHRDQRDGWIDDLVTGGKRAKGESTGLRSKLLWTPTEDIKFTLGFSYLKSDDDSAFSGRPVNGNTIARRVSPGVILAGPGQTAVTDTFFNVKQYSVWGALEWGFDGFDLNITQAWIKTESDQWTDSDVTPVNYSYATFPMFDEAYSTEVRLTSSGERTVDWIVGVHYFNDSGGYGTPDNLFLSRSTPTGATLALIADVNTEAYSVFGEATWHVNNRLSLTGGARYSFETREKEQWRSSTAFAALPTIAPLVYQGYAEKDFDDVSFRASIQYDFAENVHGFATFSQGFKSGFFNASSGLPFVAVEPENIDNYEIGLKTEPTDNLKVNLTAFYMTYDNLQVSSRSPTGASTTDVYNAAKATNYGGELTVDWRPIENWTITAGVAYQHARYDEFPLAVAFFPETSTDAALVDKCQRGTGTLLGGNRSAICDAAGLPLAKSPDWTFSLSTNYSFSALNGTIDVGGVFYWSDNYVVDLYSLVDNAGSYAVVNANISWANADDTLRITLFGTNITDTDYQLNRYTAGAATYETKARPAEFGIKVGFRFE